MNQETIKRLEEEIADLKQSWPPHSASPSLLRQLEKLEDELEKVRKAQDTQG